MSSEEQSALGGKTVSVQQTWTSELVMRVYCLLEATVARDFKFFDINF